jgi:hypothetical protein
MIMDIANNSMPKRQDINDILAILLLPLIKAFTTTFILKLIKKTANKNSTTANTIIR